MKRYRVASRDGLGNWYPPVPNDNGEWVRHDEAQAEILRAGMLGVCRGHENLDAWRKRALAAEEMRRVDDLLIVGGARAADYAAAHAAWLAARAECKKLGTK